MEHVAVDEVRRLVAGHEHRTDDDVGGGQFGGDVVGRRVERMYVGRRLQIEVAQTGQRDVGDGDLGTHAGGHACGSLTDGTATEDEHLRGFHTGHAADELTVAAFGFLQIERTVESGHATGDLAHRHEQRQTVVSGLHGLISQADGAALEHGVGQLAVGGKMEIGEEQLTFPDERILGRDGFLHLDDHLSPGIHVVDGGKDGGADLGVVVVGKATALAGSMLYTHFVTVTNQFGHACRGHAYAVLTLLNLFWNTYFHNI